ncbi:MAG: rhamnogalacturonan acetylesterase [Sphingomonas oligoaromativorans]|jgi:DNA sulfur modification protein DndE
MIPRFPWTLGVAMASMAIGGAHAAPAPGRVLIASDSTAAVYKPSQFPQMGWGMFLGCNLSPRVSVMNLARGGRSTKTFLEEGLWYGLLATLRPGDTVLIQFGHNDEDRTKMYRHTEPDAEYKANLTRFVSDVRAKGGQPVLVTPIARHEFEGGHAKDTHGAYSATVRAVAAETGTPLIDLDADFRAFIDGKGEAASAHYYLIYAPEDHVARFPDGHHDTTHLNELGARAAAAIVAKDLAALPLPVARAVRAGDADAVSALGSPVCAASGS